MNEQIRHFYEFGSFKIDVNNYLLMFNDEAIPLPRKSFDLLHLLVENQGQLVEKARIIETVWPDIFVEESSLTTAVSGLRKTLGDDAARPQYIQTVAKRGYMFVARVTERKELIRVAPRTLRFRIVAGARLGLQLLFNNPIRASILFVFAIAAIGLSGLLIRNYFRSAELRVITASFVSLYTAKSRDLGMVSDAQFSPDGKMVAYTAPGNGQNIWVMLTSDHQRQQVTRDQGWDRTPVWSPDGTKIAFISSRGGHVGIWSVSLLGGIPRLQKILEDSESVPKDDPPTLVKWSNDGQSIYFGWRQNLYILNLSTLEPTQITHLDSREHLAQSFSISRDEKWIAFTDKHDGQVDVWRVAKGSDHLIRVTNDPAIDESPIWHPDGEHLIYTRNTNDQREIYIVGLNGAEPVKIKSDNTDVWAGDISSDGTKIVCLGRRTDSDIYSVDVEKDDGESPLTEQYGLEFWPTASANPPAVIFQSITNDHFTSLPTRSSLVVKQLTPEGQTMELTDNGFAARVSPDGRTVAFLRSKGKTDLWTIPVTGGSEKQLTNEGVIFGGFTVNPVLNPYFPSEFGWAPDSSRIAFCSKRDGAPNIWSVSSDGQSLSKISANPDPNTKVNSPTWSPDGSRVAFVSDVIEQSHPANRTWTLWLWNSGKLEQVFQSQRELRLLGWTSNEKLLLGSVENTGLTRLFPRQIELLEIDSVSHKESSVLLLTDSYFTNLNLSPNGRNVSFVKSYNNRDNLGIFSLSDRRERTLTKNSDQNVHFSSTAWSPDSKTIFLDRETKGSILGMIEINHK